MKRVTAVLALVMCGPVVAQRVPADDAVRVREFYRLAGQIEDGIWPGWSKIPAPLLLVTKDEEFLTQFAPVPAGFVDAGDGFVERKRVFPAELQATFPAFDGPSVIVIGEPAGTKSKVSTPWEIVLMHEHFHQLQQDHPGYYDAVQALHLNGDDKTGMWMLNYPFPYADKDVDARFGLLRDKLLATLATKDGAEFRVAAAAYLVERKAFFASLKMDDAKYFKFQLWQEGIARYTQIAAAEAGATYVPTEAYAKLPDYAPFDGDASKLRAQTMAELRTIDLAKAGRGAVYSFGAVEGLLLDRLNPGWKAKYFEPMMTTDSLFPAP